jgi:hypothetical protein
LHDVVERIEVGLNVRTVIADEQFERFEGDEPFESLEVVRRIEVVELGVDIDATQLVHI